MSDQIAAGLASLQAAYAANQPVAAAPPPAPAAPPAFVPQQPPPGFYQASDGRMYPLPTQAPAAPPPAPAPQPAPVAAPAAPAPAAPAPAVPSGFSIPPQQAQQLAAQHASQPLPINPPEAQQALLPETQAAMPEPKRKRGGRKPANATAAAVAGTQTDGEGDLAEALAAVAALLPKGCTVTVVGEG